MFNVGAMACAERDERPEAKWKERIGTLQEKPHPVKFPEKQTKQNQHNPKPKQAYANAIQGGSQVPPQSDSFPLQHQPWGLNFRVKNDPGIKRLWNLFPWLRKSIEARSMAEISLYVGPEKLLHKV